MGENRLDTELNYHDRPGSHTKLSTVVGMRINERKLIADAVRQNPILIEYENKIYNDKNIYLIHLHNGKQHTGWLEISGYTM